MSVPHYIFKIEYRYYYPVRTADLLDIVNLDEDTAIAIQLIGKGSVVSVPDVYEDYLVIVPKKLGEDLAEYVSDPYVDPQVPNELINDVLGVAKKVRLADLPIAVELRKCRNGFYNVITVRYLDLRSVLILIKSWSGEIGYGTKIDVVKPEKADEIVEL